MATFLRLVAYVLFLGFAAGLLAKEPFVGVLAGIVCWIVDIALDWE